jgi:hypothetical protein
MVSHLTVSVPVLQSFALGSRSRPELYHCKKLADGIGKDGDDAI